MSKLYTFATYKVLLPLFVIVLFFTLYVFPNQQDKINLLANAPLTSLDVRWSYSTADVADLFDQLGGQGRTLYYMVSSKIDFIYILIYGAFFILLLANVLKKVTAPDSIWRWLALLPIVSMGFDFAENHAIQRLISTYPNLSTHNVEFAALMTQLKWVNLSGVLLIALGLWIAVGVRKYDQRGYHH